MRPIIAALLALSLAACGTGGNGGNPGSSPGYSHDPTSTANNPRWMTDLRDDVRLPALSMPGTHDSMSFYGGDAVQTQTLPLPEQLRAGVRVLDIRCRHIADAFAIHHGPFFQNAFFGEVLRTVNAFLHENPGETVLMRVSQEYDPADNTRTFEETFRELYWLSFPDLFWKGASNNPTLGEVRGKVVVLQAFSGQRYGVPYGTFPIQDDYQLGSNWDLYSKWEKVRGFLMQANVGNYDTFFMNYLSGSTGAMPYFVASGHSDPSTNGPLLSTGRTTPAFGSDWPDFPRVACWGEVCTIAFLGTNILTYDRLLPTNYARVGMLMADFPGPGLIDRTIALNRPYRK